MKVKLLKKIKKRYNWYFNKAKYPILIDHLSKKAVIYDLEYCIERSGVKIEDVKCEHTEWALRLLKQDILTKYGWFFTERWNRLNYKLANSYHKAKLTTWKL